MGRQKVTSEEKSQKINEAISNLKKALMYVGELELKDVQRTKTKINKLNNFIDVQIAKVADGKIKEKKAAIDALVKEIEELEQSKKMMDEE